MVSLNSGVRFNSGFSLLEVLVALAIAAMVVAVGLPSIWQGLGRQQDASVRLMAFGLANSKLQEFSAISRRKGMPMEGTVDGLRWRVDLGLDDQPARAGLGAALSLITVQVEVAEVGSVEPLVRLDAMRLSPKVD